MFTSIGKKDMLKYADRQTIVPHSKE